MKHPEKDSRVSMRPTEITCREIPTVVQRQLWQEMRLSSYKKDTLLLLGILSCFHLHKKLKSQGTVLRFDNKLIVKSQLWDYDIV